MKYVKQFFRLLLGAFMTYAGISHLTFNRQEFVAQVPTWLQFSPQFTYVAIFPGNINQYVNHIDAFGLNTDQARLIRLFFQPVLIFLALWTTGGWKYWKLWAKGKLKE